MRTQRFALVLTVVNLAILLFTVIRVRSAEAENVLPVLRGRALEIIDDLGRKRAEIVVLPAVTMPDSQHYAETALLRLIDPNGRPGVKISAAEDGSGMSIAGDSERREWNGIQILGKGRGSFIKITNKDGRVQVVQPQ